MPRSRLFRSIVVFGSSLGAATVFGAAGSAVSAGCELYEGRSHPGSGPWGIIDASLPDGACGGRDGGCPDAWWGFIDATPSDGSWGTIADAPNPDAAHAAPAAAADPAAAAPSPAAKQDAP